MSRLEGNDPERKPADNLPPADPAPAGRPLDERRPAAGTAARRTDAPADRANALRGLDIAALILVIIGGINWLLVGIGPLYNWDLVASIFGGVDALLSRIVYILVGLAAIYVAIRLPYLTRVGRAYPYETTGTRRTP